MSDAWKNPMVWIFLLLGAGGSVFIVTTRSREAERRRLAAELSAKGEMLPDPAGGSPASASDEKTHEVTEEMRAVSERMTARRAPDFSATGLDGRTYGVSDLTAGGKPAFLIFIKDKCPCSAAAELFYQELHRAHGAHVNFFGVIDGGREVAAGWVDRHDTPFPLLLDPDMAIVRAYEVPNSAFVAYIAPGGVIERMWPGYCDEILDEMNRMMAAAGGVPVPELTFHDVPDLPYSGCPYFLED